MSALRAVIDWLAPAAEAPAPMPAPVIEPTGDVSVVAPPAHGTCTCGCVALRIRAAHLEDKVARLTQVLATGGSIPDRRP